MEAYNKLTVAVDHRIGWQNLPKPLGLLTLIGLRNNLRRKNLFNTGGYPAQNLPPLEPPDARHLTERTPDGTYNDLTNPPVWAWPARASAATSPGACLSRARTADPLPESP
ncbi:hypothetical protein GCM10020000_02160 [Streptomyces olivoverticillatus]